MRPQYVTQSDIEAGARLAEVLGMHLGAGVLPLGTTARINYALVRARSAFDPGAVIVAFVETRQRTCLSNKYPTTILPVNKMIAGLHLATKKNVPFFIVVGYADTVRVFDSRDFEAAPTEWITTRKGGRKDRGDPGDIEELVHLDMRLSHAVVEVRPL